MIDTCLVASDRAINSPRQDSSSSGNFHWRPPKLRRTRYFTVSRIPHSSYGMYVGMTEQYSIPLYKVMGRVHVARGLADNVAYVEEDDDDDESHPQTDMKLSSVTATPSEPQLKRQKLISHLAADVTVSSVKASAAAALDAEGDEEEAAVAMLMRSRVDSPRTSPVVSTKLMADTCTSTPAATTAAVAESDLNDEEALLALIEEEEEQQSVVGVLSDAGGQSCGSPPRQETSASATAALKTSTGGKGASSQLQPTGACFTRLYRDRVRHTTLGLDLAVRLLHKHTQRRYDHPQYTQIFIPHLEEDFLTFDGMSFLDTRSACTYMFIFL